MTNPANDFHELRLDGISRIFGTHNALRDVSFSVTRGEFVALLGPSGCGKSTALNCVAGLLNLSSGAIWLDDRRIDTLKPEDRGFGMVFQNYALFPHLTVRRNISFGLEMQRRQKAEIEQRIDEALAAVRLADQSAKLPGQLSGGQQQRVAIARAIAVEPPVVLMDEPLSNLDAKLRLEMRSEIRRIHKLLGSATIYVTHDQEEALSLADRIVVLSEGSIRQIGTPEELYRRPQRPDVAEFMGFRNALEGTVVGRSGDMAEVECAIGGRVRGQMIDAGARQDALVAIRPGDLIPHPEGPIAGSVTTLEYRGEFYFGTAVAGQGAELFFRSDAPIAIGETVRLGAPEDRVLVYERR